MREVVLMLLLALAACAPKQAPASTTTSFELKQWRLPTGKPPSEAEFAALLAACQDRGKRAQGPLDPCLAQEFGMQRVQ